MFHGFGILELLMKNDKKNIFILFGATGDLAREKILPALFSICTKKIIENLTIIAVSRRNWTSSDYRDFVLKEAKLPILQRAQRTVKDQKNLDDFLSSIMYVAGDIQQGVYVYQTIKDYINTQKTKRVVAYFSVAPHFFQAMVTDGAKAGLWGEHQKVRVLLEKPYADNERSFSALIKTINDTIGKHALLVDHYLGKDVMQAIQKIRVPNKALETKIKSKLKHIVIRLFENNVADRRGEFYDKLGAFIDVGANHELQMLASLVAPLRGPKIQSEKLFASLSVNKQHVVPMQYQGYQKTDQVHKDSKTETAFEITLSSTLSYLKDVPIILAGGKGFSSYQSDMVAVFEDGSHITVTLKPREGIHATYPKIIENYPKPQEAYETIVEQAFQEKTSIFVTPEEAKHEWRIITDVKKAFAQKNIETYNKGAQVPEYDTTNPIWDML